MEKVLLIVGLSLAVLVGAVAYSQSNANGMIVSVEGRHTDYDLPYVSLEYNRNTGNHQVKIDEKKKIYVNSVSVIVKANNRSDESGLCRIVLKDMDDHVVKTKTSRFTPREDKVIEFELYSSKGYKDNERRAQAKIKEYKVQIYSRQEGEWVLTDEGLLMASRYTKRTV